MGTLGRLLPAVGTNRPDGEKTSRRPLAGIVFSSPVARSQFYFPHSSFMHHILPASFRGLGLILVCWFASLTGVAQPTYCTPGNFSGCGAAPITRVRITGTTLDNTSTCQTNGFGNAFAEYQATGGATATVRQGEAYTFGVTSSSNAASLGAWLDVNQDGTFSSSEFISITSGTSANVAALTAISIPLNAPLGLTKLRVRSRANNGSISSFDACANYSTGETEDYILTIAPAPVPAPAYCVPGNFTSNCQSAVITRVRITGTTLDNTSACQVNANGNAYAQFQATGGATATVQLGEAYTFGVTSSSSATSLGAWLDVNQDGTFSSSEFISITSGTSANVAALTVISIPLNAPLGQTSLRVRSRASNGTISSFDACAFYGSGETEDYILTVAAAPVPAPTYCTPGNFTSNCQSAVITRVKITGTTLDNISTCQVNANGNAYTQFQPTGAATGTVQQGEAYTFGVTSSSSATSLGAWLDVNQDGTFSSSEFIGITSGTSANVAALTAISIPVNAQLGQVAMRVRSRANNATISSFDACAFYGTGETEDYILTIAAAPVPAPAYCVPGNFTSNCQSAVITRVQLTGSGINNPSACQVNVNGNSYAQFQPIGGATGTVQPGVTYALGVTSSSNSATLAAWLDQNRDGTFSSNEFISISGGASANVPVFVALNISAGAALGQTTLRIRSRANNASISSFDACAFYGSGETEDYSLTIGTCALTPPTISVNAPLCTGSTLQLTAQGVPVGATYLWAGPNGFSSTLASPQILNAPATAAGTYTLSIASGSCSVSSAGLTVAVGALPNVSIAAGGPTALCQGSSVTLTATGAATYVWSTGATTPSITVGTAGTYSVAGTSAAGCSATSGATTVSVTAPPTAAISAGGPLTFCAGGSVTLTATGGGANASYQWLRGGTAIAGATTATFAATTTGSYAVTVSNAGCAATSAPTAVTVNPVPSAAFAYATSTFCVSGPTPTPIITGATGGVFSAAPAGLTLNNATGQLNLLLSIPGTYSVSYRVSGPCPATASQTVTITTAPLATFSYSGTIFCAGSPLTVTPALGSGASAGVFSAAPAGLTINAVSGVLSLATSQPGTYTVTNAIAASGGCAAASATATITVQAPPTPTISASGPTTFCAGGSVTLTGNGGFRYAWNTGATSPSITVTTSGTYTVEATNLGGCAATSAAITVTVNPVPPPPTITVQSQTGGAVLLTSSQPTGNQWFLNGGLIAGATSSTYTVATSAQNGSYTVVATLAGCPSAPSAAQNIVITGTTAAVRLTPGVTLFPVPTRDGVVTLETSVGGAASVVVIDGVGRVVWQGTLRGSTNDLTRHRLDLSALPTGSYVLHLTTATGTATRRLMRE